MKRVLLTGARGFIGGHCLPILLARGYEVHAISSKESIGSMPRVYWHRVDLLESAQVVELMTKVRPTHLLHFAWYTVPGKYWTSLENFRWVQAGLTLLQTFEHHGGQRAVIAGTCAEYDWRYGFCSEQTTPLLPATLYGACKHALQVMSNAFAKQTGLNSAWGRIFFLYGPHELPTRLISSVIRSILQGKPACCSRSNQIRDFLDVRDVADAFADLLDSDVSGSVNIASGCPVSLREIVCKIADKLNRPDLIQLDGLSIPTNEPLLLLADINRLSAEVGWRQKFDLDTGLDQTIEWWRNNLVLNGRDTK